MLRVTVLTASVLALAGSATDPYSFSQRGTVATPRAALHDGQPLSTQVRIEGHASATTRSSIDAYTDDGNGGGQVLSGDSGAAVARNQAGGAIRFRASDIIDLGFEVDSSWSPTHSTRDGALINGPNEPVVDVALAVRGSSKAGDDGLRIGWVANLGSHSTPIRRGDDPSAEVSRNGALLFRAAIVPSLRRGVVTLFGSLGFASETDVPSEVNVAGNSTDPGVQANATGAAFVLAAGASVDLGKGAHLTARIGDAFTDQGTTSNYGPQVDIGLAFDVGN